MATLASESSMKFPFRVGPDGPATSNRAEHVREQIEQVLFTAPGERVFRPEFGAGLRNLVFEPNTSALRQVTEKRLVASLAEALKGEVDPRTLEVVLPEEGDEKLRIIVTYQLATLGHRERHELVMAGGGQGG